MNVDELHGTVVRSTKTWGGKTYKPRKSRPALKVLMVKNGHAVEVSAGRRTIVSKAGQAFIRCLNENHKGRRLIPATNFYFTKNTMHGGYFFFSTCKKCQARIKNTYRTPHFNNHGFVPTKEVKPYLDSLIKKAGGKTRAAKLCGTSHSALIRWEKCQYKTMRANSAEKIFTALRELERR
jgi:hypothetical protein